jgi:hypothetical protein
LAQLPALLFLLATAALGWQAWRHPRPLHTAMLLALLCLWWMLPRVFLQPVLLPALSSAALLLMLGAMLQESFHMAFRDELTGLPGRRAFNETLQRARGTYSIAMVDVDHFKSFNDTHGHDTGDDVLRLVASRLAGGRRWPCVPLWRRGVRGGVPGPPGGGLCRCRRSAAAEHRGHPHAAARPQHPQPRRRSRAPAARTRRQARWCR